MGKITKIEDQKNKKRFNIFVDNAFFCGLIKEVAVLANLKVGKEINEEELEKLIFDSEVKMVFEKASSYIATREHSKKELFDKLLKKGYQRSIIDAAISKLEEYHYIDDEVFARHYVMQNGKYSKMVLEGKLRQKGVSNDIIKSVLDDIEDKDQLELCKKQAIKYLNGKDLKKEGLKEKLFASLLRKGFKINDIKRAIKEFSFDNDIFFD